MIKLFEFAKKKQQQKEPSIKNQIKNQKQFSSQNKPKQNKHKNISQIDNEFNLDTKSNNSQKSVGLSTLLHFAGEDDESSIHFSKYQDEAKINSNGFNKTKYENQFRLKSELKNQIEQMKQKRIALQDKKNKRKIAKYPASSIKQHSSSQISQQSFKAIQKQSYSYSYLNQNQKTPYKPNESSYLVMLNSREQEQQSYFKYLLQENTKLKLEKFTNRIQKFCHSYLVKHIIIRLQVKKLEQKIQKKQNFQLQKQIFLKWKMLARQQSQRNQLIQTIKTKILNKRLQCNVMNE